MQHQCANSIDRKPTAAMKSSVVDCVDEERRPIMFHIGEKPAASKCKDAAQQSSEERPAGAISPCLDHQQSYGATSHNLHAGKRPDRLNCSDNKNIHGVFQVEHVFVKVTRARVILQAEEIENEMTILYLL